MCMMLLGIDGLLLLLIVAYGVFLTGKQSGFWFDPYLGIQVVLLVGPPVLMVANVVLYPLLYGYHHAMWYFVLTPLAIVLLLRYGLRVNDRYREWHYKRNVQPVKDHIASLLAAEGYETSYVHLLPKNEARIELKERYDAVLAARPDERERLRQLINHAYPHYKVLLFAKRDSDYRRAKKH